jgi:hypothetical protein
MTETSFFSESYLGSAHAVSKGNVVLPINGK